jgi:hypothetical protein
MVADPKESRMFLFSGAFGGASGGRSLESGYCRLL